MNPEEKGNSAAGVILKILRERRNFTYKELSSKLDGVPIDLIIDLESGALPMTNELARKISNLFDVPISLFLK
ncbi:DNA-binding helix-turn-helix protein [Leptospira inadai serovar Lyme str. 10]|uniref:DNA-binding helix-turn-helix protein n=2 Tax=Leptospira inadai serovar Lyme TaxID=293084 RepID=V6I0V5_9LEPT|nr:helix-turn-helix transcriptional regulator [Leptospira inadai]EQA38894.1 DNA-binding helix-turn-helix protein [Leptospira inadai serovar Lyme str. 10]PNV72124.1 XRE family transcriptional regulator [Leptospira inadai serovar Lyme]